MKFKKISFDLLLILLVVFFSIISIVPICFVLMHFKIEEPIAEIIIDIYNYEGEKYIFINDRVEIILNHEYVDDIKNYNSEMLPVGVLEKYLLKY